MFSQSSLRRVLVMFAT